MIIRRSGLEIKKDYPEKEHIMNILTRYISEYGNIDYIKKVFYIEDEDGGILIPRYYPISDEIVDMSEEGENIDIESIIEPRNERQRKAIDFLINNTKGILQLEPGSGKTVVTIAAICKIKKKTIIFAHKDSLIEQWKNEFLKFTNIKKSDMGRLSSSNYQKCLKTKKIIFSTPHIIPIDLKKDKKIIQCLQNSRIGVMVVDECHVGIGPEQFSKSSIFIPSKRTFGLSATPSRSDGNDDLLNYHLGDVTTFPSEEGELIKPIVFMIYFPFKIYSGFYKYVNWGGKFILSRYYKQMVKSKYYNKLVSKWIRESYEKGRKTLVLGKNIKPLLQLISDVGCPKEDVGIFSPGAKDKKYIKQTDKLTDTMDMDIAFKEKKIVFSTYTACRDGNNRPDLDCLIMSCPTSNVEQAIGRVLRYKEGKKQPIVLDLVDTEGPMTYCKALEKKVSMFENMSEKRLELYKKKKWDVKIVRIKEK